MEPGPLVEYRYRLAREHFWSFVRYVGVDRRRVRWAMGLAAALVFPTLLVVRPAMSRDVDPAMVGMFWLGLAITLAVAWALYWYLRLRKQAIALEAAYTPGTRTLRVFEPGYTITVGLEVHQRPWADLVDIRQHRGLMLFVVRDSDPNFLASFMPEPDPQQLARICDTWRKGRVVPSTVPTPAPRPTEDVA